MPDNEVNESGSGVVFGLASYAGAVAGLSLQSVTYGESAQMAEAIGEDGEIEQVDVYAKKKTIQCEGNVKSGNSNALHVGGTLSVDGVDFTIDTVSVKETVTGHKTATITGSAPYNAAGGNGGGNGE